jgi:hypothetical protein
VTKARGRLEKALASVQELEEQQQKAQAKAHKDFEKVLKQKAMLYCTL